MFFEPRRVEKPWGYEIWWAETDRYVAKLLHINEARRLSWQFHRVKDETLLLLRGSVQLRYEDATGEIVETTLEPDRPFRVKPGTKHRLIGGIGGGEVLEASSPEIEDVVRLEDEYGRID